MKRKVLIVFGTRPEAIKMAPVVKACKDRPELEVKVCVTAQHRQMLDQEMQVFGLRADFDLDVMAPGQSLADVTCKVLKGMEGVLTGWKPDLVLVQGDTTTVMAAALAAFYNRIAVGHVEAGLRTGDLYNPWPEEVNRLVAGNIAAFHFAPTQRAADNLLRENKDPSKVFVTGNTVIDALRQAVKVMDGSLRLRTELAGRFKFLDPSKKLLLVTGHRRENFGDGLVRICKAIEILSSRPDVQIVYPLHMNPNVRKPVEEILGGLDTVHLIEPQDYLSFLFLIRRSHLVLTDSGGIQEEAPSLGKPVVVMRDTTERPEAVEAGTAVLAGTDTDSIVAATERLLNDRCLYDRMSQAVNPYGDGFAAERIAEIISR